MALLVACCAAAAWPGRGLGQESPDRSSPRATFKTFLERMNDYREQDDTSGLHDAVACLDFSRVSRDSRDVIQPERAGQLKTVLEKIEKVVYAKIPDRVPGDRWNYYRAPGVGEITLARTPGGLWLFSAQTVSDLPKLEAAFKQRGFVRESRGGAGAGAPHSLADWIRARAPGFLGRVSLLLENWQWIGLLAIALIGVIADRVLSLVLGLWLGRWLERRQATVDRSLKAGVARPIGLLALAVIWYLLLPVLDLPDGALNAVLFAAKLVMAFAGVWVAYRVVDLIGDYFAALAARTESRFDDVLVPLLRRSLKVLVLAVGLVFIADNLDIDIAGLLMGLGIGGVAIALAAKDTVENLFGSLTVLVDKPFQIGDWVVIGGKEGTVEEVGFRSTRIRTFYNSVITIPNAQLVNASVDNMGRRRYRRVKCMIAIEYGTLPEKIDALCEGIRELIRRHPYTRKDYYLVYFNEFADSALNILLYAFHEVPDWATELRERHRLFVDIVRLARRLGVEFAFPTQTLHVASLPQAARHAPDTGILTRPAASPEAAGGDPDAAPRPPTPDETMRLGRAEAEAIVKGVWGDPAQGPVSFTDPDSIRPGSKSA